MATNKFELNTRTVGELLRSQELKEALDAFAATVAARAGEGYGHDTKMMDSRVIASVYTEDIETANREAEENNLLKAVY